MTDASIPQIVCTRCGETFPATPEYFYKSKHGSYGLRTRCKTCHKAEVRRYNIQNPEKHRERRRRYDEAHREIKRERDRLYRTTNPDKGRERTRRRRARKANTPSTFTAEHERLALDYFNGCCAVCGRQLKDLFGTHTAHFDHWIPLSKGGATAPENMIPLCGGQGGCNSSKGARDAIEWLHTHYGKHKAKQILARIEAYFTWISKRE